VRLGGTAPDPPSGRDEQRQVAARARRYLDQVLPRARFRLVTAPTVADAAAAVADAACGEHTVLALLVVDHADHRRPGLAPAPIGEEVAKLEAALPEHVIFRPSPLTVQVHTDPDTDARLSVERHSVRWPATEEWVPAADLTCAFTDAVQSQLTDRFSAAAAPQPGALASALARFLDREAGDTWGLHYYTGSVVARFIDDLERHASAHGNPVVRGPSEHSLACSALARWTLDDAPFVIAVTSGMADELRGTLANLRAARARGFLVFPDSLPEQWYPFQGTITTTEDSRAVMRARGVPTVHIDRPDRLAERLAEAFEAYASGQGPVALFVTRDVLESTAPVELPAAPPPAAAVTVGEPPGFTELLDTLNTAPRRLLCQVGPLGPVATEAMYDLARRAGIALVDSLTHPGTVCRYPGGGDREVREYLGTLSLYGYSARVYEFLHSDGRLRPAEEQSLLFVNSPVPEVATPFTQRVVRGLRPIQLTAHAEDVAPFAGLGVVGAPDRLLAALAGRVRVSPEVLALRRAAIDDTAPSFSDVVGLLPTLPMTANHFFRRLHDVLDGLITRHGYRYTGVFDVGRSGLSAVCNLPRTGPGFSGWFGRALMGDALMALPGIALHPTSARRAPDDVLAFVGDGAYALVPDVLPALVHQIVADGVGLRRNVSVFRFANGAHSVIRSYREAMRPGAVSGQTGVLSLCEQDWTRRIEGLTVTHRRLTTVDGAALAEQLREPGVINLYTVPLAHNNEGDGLSRLSAAGWQRDALTSGALAMAGARPAGVAR
ncbi:MAG TPA: hypothetical protein VGD67_22785, partial [Pseudonocardiaceae bacterium]